MWIRGLGWVNYWSPLQIQGLPTTWKYDCVLEEQLGMFVASSVSWAWFPFGSNENWTKLTGLTFDWKLAVVSGKILMGSTTLCLQNVTELRKFVIIEAKFLQVWLDWERKCHTSGSEEIQCIYYIWRNTKTPLFQSPHNVIQLLHRDDNVFSTQTIIWDFLRLQSLHVRLSCWP